ncbi:hypothetical protein CDD83_9919 [Cordyceps sp. RAO-2017]|nr:hypothetical protein CDD83_9919 [Cordyceps sp. RAO-2017]
MDRPSAEQCLLPVGPAACFSLEAGAAPAFSFPCKAAGFGRQGLSRAQQQRRRVPGTGRLCWGQRGHALPVSGHQEKLSSFSTRSRLARILRARPIMEHQKRPRQSASDRAATMGAAGQSSRASIAVGEVGQSV